MNLLPKNVRHVVLLSVDHNHIRAAVAEQSSQEWRIVSESATVHSWSEELGQILQPLLATHAARHAIVVTPHCRSLLLNQTVPAELTAQQGREMLRWEVSAMLADQADEHGLDTHTVWETGHAACGPRQTSVATIPADLQNEFRKDLQQHGLKLIAILPTLMTGWSQLLHHGVNGKGALAIAQHGVCESSLAIFEQGQLEFYAVYPALSGAWSQNLLADARSFPVKKLLVINEPEAEHLAALPQLPESEIPAGTTQTFWSTALLACQLGKNIRLPHSVPMVACVEPTQPIWKLPAAWWTAGLGIITLTIFFFLLGWVGELRAMKQDLAQINASIADTLHRLRAFEEEAMEYDRLEQELHATELEIKTAVADSQKPGNSPCAQVSYLKDALNAAAKAYSGNIRLEGFKADYTGRVFVQGQSINDATALGALSKFYELVKKHPVLPSVMSSTKEGAPPGRILFMADETQKAILKANYAARLAAAQESEKSTMVLASPAAKKSSVEKSPEASNSDAASDQQSSSDKPKSESAPKSQASSPAVQQGERITQTVVPVSVTEADAGLRSPR